ncbi:MAG: helix-turn-helix transcriptional regulator [Gemmatimonadetes bacterium]|nr:helix-turn-helix transcriptional regulator [Gemmatimonadota bacterium]
MIAGQIPVKLSDIYSVVGDMAGKMEIFLAEFELYVLLALVRLGGEAYGAAIRREIESTTGRSVSIGAVYATLGRLDDKRLLRHRISEPLPMRGGRARKFYRLTAKGECALRHSTSMLHRMMTGPTLSLEAEV